MVFTPPPQPLPQPAAAPAPPEAMPPSTAAPDRAPREPEAAVQAPLHQSEIPLSTEELRMLPMLRSAARMRHGLENLKLNVLREAGENRPDGLAIINLNKVYIGERIPETRAILIGVEYRGIGIEIIESGERFYVPK
jgi:hypothetical protein